MVLKWEPLDWESSALSTRPLLHYECHSRFFAVIFEHIHHISVVVLILRFCQHNFEQFFISPLNY